ncbi:Putative amidase domain-containing protein [Paenibacillus sophorae]|uniref:Amidase domain-containing protein n=1 Tax=Paenibacillus sophorae TaxID=1333845 RepID=A0A1H8Q9R1_9BACL|nr:amidase domain-containing protein [Paenibacillus sophorae]QWU15213.1 amidase domain-containing protein [Paenibacillus sophorae]SEO50945.1 Putative amidase domain-containing protein [Paenibacillus sophorae]
MLKKIKKVKCIFFVATFFIAISLSLQTVSAAGTTENTLSADNQTTSLVKNVTDGNTKLNVTTLKETDITKKEALNKYKKGFDIVKKYIIENNIMINEDLDNIKYQSLILSLGTSLDYFSESDRDEIVKLVKFIDLYENSEKNKKIKEYKSKLDTKTINQKELSELVNLLPVSPSDPTTVLSSVYETPRALIIQPLAYSNGYSSINARDYAYQWWDGRNPTYSNYYANYFGCSIYDECWNDCTNFVSQALYAGGMKQWRGQGVDSWYFDDGWLSSPSHSWGGAHNFYEHWKNRATLASDTSSISMGDPVNADFERDGDINHTAIITLFSNGHFYLTQHTTDKKDNALSTWYYENYNVYVWRMSTALNY